MTAAYFIEAADAAEVRALFMGVGQLPLTRCAGEPAKSGRGDGVAGPTGEFEQEGVGQG